MPGIGHALPVKGGGHPRSRIGGKRIVDIAGGPSTRGIGACFADERTPEPAEVRGAVQRSGVGCLRPSVHSSIAFRQVNWADVRSTPSLREPTGCAWFAPPTSWTRCAGADRRLVYKVRLSAKATPEAKRGGEAPLRVVGVVGTRSTPSQPGQQVTNRLVSNTKSITQQAHSGPPKDALGRGWKGSGPAPRKAVRNGKK